LAEPDTYTVLMGDTFDFARTHFRRHLRAYGDDENSVEAIDEWVRHDVRELAGLLEPVKSRILGVVCGNHHHRFLDTTNTEQYLCQVLGLPYLGAMGVLRLDVRGKSRAIDRIRVYAHHDGGTHGGRTHGGDINALMRQQDVVQADIYLLSHTHDTYGKKWPQRVVTDTTPPRIVTRTRAFARTGCFRRGKVYEATVNSGDNPDYAVKAAYPPRQAGYVEISLSWSEGHRNMRLSW